MAKSNVDVVDYVADENEGKGEWSLELQRVIFYSTHGFGAFQTVSSVPGFRFVHRNPKGVIERKRNQLNSLGSIAKLVTKAIAKGWELSMEEPSLDSIEAFKAKWEAPGEAARSFGLHWCVDPEKIKHLSTLTQAQAEDLVLNLKNFYELDLDKLRGAVK